jgi:hypothetical protein
MELYGSGLSNLLKNKVNLMRALAMAMLFCLTSASAFAADWRAQKECLEFGQAIANSSPFRPYTIFETRLKNGHCYTRLWEHGTNWVMLQITLYDGSEPIYLSLIPYKGFRFQNGEPVPMDDDAVTRIMVDIMER